MPKMMTSMLLDVDLVEAKHRLRRTYAELIEAGIKAIDKLENPEVKQ